MFGRSLRSLQEELQRLKSQQDSQAIGLIGRGINSEQLVKELMPTSQKVVALQNEIYRRTPQAVLKARRNELQNLLEGCPDSDRLQKHELTFELQRLDNYFKYQVLLAGHDRQLTLKRFLILVAGVAALGGFQWFVGKLLEWFAP